MNLFRSSVVVLAVACALAQSTFAKDPPSVPELKLRAAELEKMDKPLKAARVYEQIIVQDPSLRRLLAHRLAQVYAMHGKEKKALLWAAEVMEKNPDPQAYLAGIHTLLGNFKEARRILKSGVDQAKMPRQKIALLWQLADVCEKDGDISEAEGALRAAVIESKDSSSKRVAERRLASLLKRQGKNSNSEPEQKEE